ncbi:MAG: DUF1540 domain-containing protein [Clostridiales bacterium]|nr:DUF1540 domain-containing protein [Clostridiales bacterium]
MEERVPRKNEPLAGVKYTVDSCYYNRQGQYCNATKIEIQPPGAVDTKETDCATFIMG